MNEHQTDDHQNELADLRREVREHIEAWQTVARQRDDLQRRIDNALDKITDAGTYLGPRPSTHWAKPLIADIRAALTEPAIPVRCDGSPDWRRFTPEIRTQPPPIPKPGHAE